MSVSRSVALARKSRVATSILVVGALLLGCTPSGTTTESPAATVGPAASDGTAGPVSTAPAEQTTITVMYASNELSADQIAAFEAENPDITVDFVEFDQERLNAMMTSGDPPDFVRSAPSANLFARGLASPIDDYLASSTLIKEADLLPVNDNWRWDGSTVGVGTRYGLVKDYSPDASLWQNEALFEKAGIEPFSTTEPVSWDQVLDAAKKLKAAGVKNGLGVEWQWGILAQMMTMIEQQGGELYSADLATVNFTSPEAQRAVQWFADYGKAEVGPTSLNPVADGWDMPVFAAGDMAMTTDGYWFGANFIPDDYASLRDTISMIPAPTWGTRVNPSYNGGIGGYIPAASKHKDQAWRFMEWFMGGQPAIDRAKSGWGLPSLNSLWDQLPSQFPYQQAAIETSKGELEHFATLPDSPYISASSFIDIVNNEVTAVLQDKKSVAEACQSIESQVNELLQQGKDQLGQ